MRALFNNPWFVGALGALSLIYLVVTVVQPLLTAQTTAVINPVTGAPAFEDDMFAATDPKQAGSDTATEREAIRWLEDVQRDPFAEYLKQQPAGKTTEEAIEQQSQRPALPKLDALFYGQGVKAAVLNSQLRGVGDFINDYRILEVDADTVTLEYAGKQYRIEPDAS
ncbi:MAG: hypothetical protein AAGG11_21865 [Pseudomonadota bacterium]